MTLRAMMSEATKLTPGQREQLIDELLRLNHGADLSLTKEQAADLDLRIEEFEAGKADLQDGETFMDELRRERQRDRK